MKTAIIYASIHHGNTKKVVESMAECISADLIDITKDNNPDIFEYDLIGFASGIYFNSLHKNIVAFIDGVIFDKKQKVFLVATCGANYKDHTKSMKKILKQKDIDCVGSFQCKGYDTYGFWGKIGGIAKGHPNQKDLENAQNFIKEIISE